MTAISLNLIEDIYVVPRKNDYVTDIFVKFGVNNLNDMIIYEDCFIGDPNTQLFLWKSIGYAQPNKERSGEHCSTLNYAIAGKIARELEERITSFIAEDEEFKETTTSEWGYDGVPQFSKV